MHLEYKNRCSCYGNEIFLEQGSISTRTVQQSCVILLSPIAASDTKGHFHAFPEKPKLASPLLKSQHRNKGFSDSTEVTHHSEIKSRHFPNKAHITRHINKLVSLRINFHLKSLLKCHKIFTDSSFNTLCLLHLPFLSLRNYLKVYQGSLH